MDESGEVDQARLGWLASVRLLGWRGRRATQLDLDGSLAALVRHPRGRRRVATLRARVVEHLGRCATAVASSDPPDPRDVERVLERLRVCAPWRDTALAEACRALASFVGLPALLDATAGWLGGGLGRALAELAAADRLSPLLAVVDLEVDASAAISEVTVVVVRGGRPVRRLDLVGDVDAGRLSAWLFGCIVVAHNGDSHDFTVLEAHGVVVPPQRIDTLRWAWLAAPGLASHSLPSVCEWAGVAIEGSRHRASVDADILVALLPRLVASLARLRGDTSRTLQRLLRGHVADEVFELLLPPPDTSGSDATDDPWRRPDRVSSAGSGERLVEQCPDMAAWRSPSPDRLVVVRALASAPPCPGRWASGPRLIDPGWVSAARDGAGWAAAIAQRVLEEVHGMVAGWPDSARDLLDEVRTREPGRYVCGPGPWLTDVESVADEAPDRPVVLVDAVDLLFGGVEPRRDPAGWSVPVTALVDHSGPTRTEMDRLWEAVLGGPVMIRGSAAPVRARTHKVSGLQVAVRPDIAVARVAAVAAGRALSVSTVLVTARDRAELIRSGLSAECRSRLGGPLLRPPAWPTVTEARHRLREATHLAVATSGPAGELARSGADLVLDRIGAPSTDNPIVARMLAECSDAYGEVIEPVAALRLLRLLSRARGDVWICDPAADSPLVRTALASSGDWQVEDIAALEDTDAGRWAAGAIVRSGAGDDSTGDAGPYVDGAVRRLLGHGAALRPEQQVVVESVLDGHDVLAVFRTGFGKSVCFQVPALALGEAGHGATLVVSPLIALQRDQVARLHRQRVWEATALNGELEASVRGARLRGIAAGFYRIVYVAPEGLHSEALREVVRVAGLALVAVDEAHCVSEMGHDFRPDYRTIPVAIRRILGFADNTALADSNDRPRVLALTGTASPATRRDIVEQLDGRFRIHVDSQFVRPELSFSVRHIDEEPGRSGDLELDHPVRVGMLCDLLGSAKTPAIVYAPTRRDTEHLARVLGEHRDDRIAAYHAGLAPADRERVERAFTDGLIDIVVATSAFGMGVDKADIRTVVHWRMPGSPEALYQEAGRAGRGAAGQPARCVVLYHPSDLTQAARISARSVPTQRDLLVVWSTLEELHQLQGAPGRVIVDDADLARLAGLRSDVDPGVVVAYLQRAELLMEGDRHPASIRLRATGTAPPSDLPLTEQMVVQLLPRAGEEIALSPAAVADWLVAAGTAATLHEVRAAVRHLASVGVVEIMPATVIVRALTGQVDHVVATAWQDARAVARRLIDQAWTAVRPQETGLPVDRIVAAVELLATMGCVQVAGASGQSSVPRVRPGRRPLRELTLVAAAAGAVCADAVRRAGAPIPVDDIAVAHDLAPVQVREALLSGHVSGALALDPRSWEDGNARASNGATRMIRFRQDSRAPEEALREAAAEARTRGHDTELRRRALHAYATLDVDEEGSQVHQQYLERYFTDTTFLSDIEARDVEKIVEGLDAEQLQAVRSAGRRVVIRAGAGTGKTRTLTRRIAHQVATGQSLASETLAVCFGRDPKDEMVVRLASLGISGVLVSTLNSLGWSIVRDHWPRLGRPAAPELLTNSRQTIAQLARRHDDKADGTAIALAVERAKARLEHPGRAGTDGKVDRALLNTVYAEYEAQLAERNMMDFQDQIGLAVRLLADPDVRAQVCGPITEVFVDEAQDLSPAQWALVEAYASTARLTVVGDPRQAIFEWNGADPAMFERLAREEGTVTTDLVRNYRSRSQLLDVPNHVMRAYPPLRAVDERPGDSTAANQPSVAAHDEKLVDVVRAWLDDGVADDEIAVVCRADTSVQRVAQALRRAGLPTRELGLPPLHTTVAFRLAQHHLPHAYDAGEDSVAAAMAAVAQMREVESSILGASATGDDPWADWHRLTAELTDLERAGVTDLTEAFRRVRQDAARHKRSDGGIVVTTIHKAKGLEWEAVVFADANAQSLPDKPENRRLAYVALTRARSRRRVLSHAEGRGRARFLTPPRS